MLIRKMIAVALCFAMLLFVFVGCNPQEESLKKSSAEQSSDEIVSDGKETEESNESTSDSNVSAEEVWTPFA